MSVFQEFSQLFSRLNYVTVRALFDREDEFLYQAWEDMVSVAWECRMYNMLKKARGEWAPNLLDKEDVKQEINFIWLQCEKSQGEKLTEEYLKQITIWWLRDWTIKQSKIVQVYPYYYFLEEKPEFLLDLSFLVFGTRVYPFSTLAPYERYLIFLRYREEKTILQIAKIVCKNKNTVQRELRWILDKLRRLSNEEEDTVGPCSRGDGCTSATREYSEGCSPWNRATSPEARQ